MKKTGIYIATAVSMALAGCAGKNKKEELPQPEAVSTARHADWVFADPANGETVYCVKKMNTTTMTAQKVSAMEFARADLASQLTNLVDRMASSYVTRVQGANGGERSAEGLSNTNTAKTEVRIIGSRVSKWAYVRDARFADDAVRMCVKMVIPQDILKKLVEDAFIQRTDGQASTEDADAIFQDFQEGFRSAGKLPSLEAEKLGQEFENRN